MLYKFESRASAPLILLGRSGERILRIIGKSPLSHGVIEAAEMAHATDLLTAAIDEEETVEPRRYADGDGDGESARDISVGLRQRAWPLIEMMERSQTSGHDIVWTVSGVHAATVAPAGDGRIR